MGGQRHRLHDQLKQRSAAAALLLAFAGSAPAQVVLDGTLGAPGALAGPNYAIGNALGRQVGANLFHSFSQFSLASGQSATFSGLPGTANIIGRVTGAASSIDGTLRSTIAGANLWLINPRGMAFGPNARLDVQGSFHASTASYLRLGTSGRFDAANPGASVLSVDAPVAFGFLGTPAALTVDRSQLTVPTGATLSLVGGDIAASGTAAAKVRLEAPGGRINLASLAGPDEAVLAGGAIGTDGSGALGSISLSNAIVATDIPSTTQLPGPIVIRGGKLALENSTLSTLQFTPGVGSDVDIVLSGDFSMNGGVIRATSLGNGDAGDVSIRAGSMTIAGGAVIDVSAARISGGVVLGGGRAGRISIDASGDATITGNSSLSSFTFGGAGPAGDSRIAARNLIISDNAHIDLSTFGSGAAGNLSVAVQNLTLASGGRIAAAPQFDIASTPASGAGGRIDVNASATVDISGTGSGLFTATAGQGQGGSITVSARDITVSAGGQINSGSEDRFNLGLIGDAGSINLNATGSIRLQGGAAITTQATTAGGGAINIRAADTVGLAYSRITTSVADGSGNGGNILIDPVFVVLDHSQILARAFAGNGGDITISTQYLFISPFGALDQSINASSERGISGSIVVISPNSDVGTRIAALNSSYVDAASRLRETCASRAGRTGNSFTGVGRGGLPASPDGAAYADYGFGGKPRATLAAPQPLAHDTRPGASVLLSCPG